MSLTLTGAIVLKQTNLITTTVYHIPRRFRYKPKWASNLSKTSSRKKALSHYDGFYGKFYGHHWPLIRVSLLSLNKHCAVVNKYAGHSNIQEKLSDLGTDNFVGKAKQKFNKSSEFEQYRNRNLLGLENERRLNTPNYTDDNLTRDVKQLNIKDDVRASEDISEYEVREGQDIDPLYDDLYKDNLEVFVPATRILSEREELIQEELDLNSFEPRDIQIEVQKPDSLSISSSIEAYAFPKGDPSPFPPAKSYNYKGMDYYIMDASSVLPVIALDIQPDDHVLDLCAAPGGKSVMILQDVDVLNGGSFTCNDSSKSRAGRLQNVLNQYFPAEICNEVTVLKHKGQYIDQCVYNKVLVDVPCNADRHNLLEEENNLFKPNRVYERMEIMDEQRELLVAAIKCCVVNGSVVYATCTLAPAQNDGVIQAVVEELIQTTEIEVVVEDLSPLASLFSDTFTFLDKGRYGQTVIPSLTNNFGPSYFAKLRRIK